MKQAMFGIGRDEAVNMQLLGDFINDQHSQTGELDELIKASKDGNLSTFTFNPTADQQSQATQPQAGQQQLEQQQQVDLGLNGKPKNDFLNNKSASLLGLKVKGRQITQADIEHTMKITGKTEEEILTIFRNKLR